MATLTYLGITYNCAEVIKGDDYVHVLDANGLMIASFDKVKDFSAFVVDGCDWSYPTPEKERYIAVYNCDGTICKSSYKCDNIEKAFKPLIVVTAPEGSTVTCSKNDIELSGTIDGTTWQFVVPEYGEYLIYAHDANANSVQRSVEVTQVAMYNVNIMYLQENFADNSWEAIIDACKNNNVPASWVAGSSKTMSVEGTDYNVVIIGRDHDTYAEGGTAPLTFQMESCGTATMHNENNNKNGWKNCMLRLATIPEFIASLPLEIRDSLRDVIKHTSIGNNSATIGTTFDKVFLLSAIEANAFNSVYAAPGEGNAYEYYVAGNLMPVGDYWVRSPVYDDNSYYCHIDVTSSSNNMSAGWAFATYSLNVSYCFCF